MIKVTGREDVQKKLSDYDANLNRKIVQTLGKYANEMELYAKANHRFTSISNNLERSIEARVKTENKRLHILTFQINPQWVKSGKYNYGVIQHDGRGSGYLRSPMSPNYGTNNKGNLQHDHFMWNAFQKYITPMKRDLRKLGKEAYGKS
jgi:hypothetical protein